MSKFVLHPEAYSDLSEIWEYVAADNHDAADRLLDEIYASLTLPRSLSKNWPLSPRSHIAASAISCRT